MAPPDQRSATLTLIKIHLHFIRIGPILAMHRQSLDSSRRHSRTPARTR